MQPWKLETCIILLCAVVNQVANSSQYDEKESSLVHHQNQMVPTDASIVPTRRIAGALVSQEEIIKNNDINVKSSIIDCIDNNNDMTDYAKNVELNNCVKNYVITKNVNNSNDDNGFKNDEMNTHDNSTDENLKYEVMYDLNQNEFDVSAKTKSCGDNGQINYNNLRTSGEDEERILNASNNCINEKEALTSNMNLTLKLLLNNCLKDSNNATFDSYEIISEPNSTKVCNKFDDSSQEINEKYLPFIDVDLDIDATATNTVKNDCLLKNNIRDDEKNLVNTINSDNIQDLNGNALVSKHNNDDGIAPSPKIYHINDANYYKLDLLNTLLKVSYIKENKSTKNKYRHNYLELLYIEQKAKKTSPKDHKLFIPRHIFSPNSITFITSITPTPLNLEAVKKSSFSKFNISLDEPINSVTKCFSSNLNLFSSNPIERYHSSVKMKPRFPVSVPSVILTKSIASNSDVCPANAIFFSPNPCKLCNLFHMKPGSLTPNAIKTRAVVVKTLIPVLKNYYAPYNNLVTSNKYTKSNKLLQNSSKSSKNVFKDLKSRLSFWRYQNGKVHNLVTPQTKPESVISFSIFKPASMLKQTKNILPVMKLNSIRLNSFTFLSKYSSPNFTSIIAKMSPTVKVLKSSIFKSFPAPSTLIYTNPIKIPFCGILFPISNQASANHPSYTVASTISYPSLLSDGIFPVLPQINIPQLRVFNLYNILGPLPVSRSNSLTSNISKKIASPSNSCRLHQKEPCNYVPIKTDYNLASSSLNNIPLRSIPQSFEKVLSTSPLKRSRVFYLNAPTVESSDIFTSSSSSTISSYLPYYKPYKTVV